MKRSLLFLVLVACGTSCCAFAQSNGYALEGAGASSCGDYLAHEADPSISSLFVTWTQGFLSGMNMADHIGAKKLPFVLLPDGETIKAYLDKYCRDNPLESPVIGAGSLYRELRARQKQ